MDSAQGVDRGVSFFNSYRYRVVGEMTCNTLGMTRTGVRLRKLAWNPVGFAVVQHVLNHARAYSVASFGHQLTGVEGRKTFEMVYQNPQRANGEIFAIESLGDTVVVAGFITCSVREGAGYIHFLVVDERFRGQGIGGDAVKKLTQHLHHQARVVRLKVFPRNERTESFWLLQGFECVGEFDAESEKFAGSGLKYALFERAVD